MSSILTPATRAAIHSQAVRLNRQATAVLKSVAAMQNKSSAQVLHEMIEAERRKLKIPVPEPVTISKASKASEITFEFAGQRQSIVLDTPQAISLARAIHKAIDEGFASKLDDLVISRKGRGVKIIGEGFYVSYATDIARQIADQLVRHFKPAK